jgi:hypothetical protein
MNTFAILFFIYLIIYYANTAPTSNINGSSMKRERYLKFILHIISLDIGLLANGKVNDEPTCKTDNGQSKFREIFCSLIYYETE